MPGSFADAYIEQPGGGGGGDVPSTRMINTTFPLSGGGDLSADRTLAIDPNYFRIKANNSITYYVRTDGNDANDGSANDAAHAFATVTHAYWLVQDSIDLNLYGVTVYVADGVYDENVFAGDLVGGGYFEVIGNVATPGNVVFSPANGPAFTFYATRLMSFYLDGVRVESTDSNGIQVSGTAILSTGAIEYGPVSRVQLYIHDYGSLIFSANYTITDSAMWHFLCEDFGTIIRGALTGITVTGTPAFSETFAEAKNHGSIRIWGTTITGSATGKRFRVGNNGSIQTNTTDAPDLTFFPGDVAGEFDGNGCYNNITQYLINPLTTLGDILYEDATPAPARLPGNTSTVQKFLAQTGDGVNSAAPSWEAFPASGLSTYFFIDTASNIATYKQAVSLSNYTPSTEASVTITNAIDTQIIQSFATNAGFPGVTFLPDGLIHVHLHAVRAGLLTSAQLYAEVYTRTTGGSETLIATTEDSNNLTLATAEYDIHAVLSDVVTLNSTDRIVVKVRVHVTGTPNITIYYDGNTQSRIELPAPAVDVTNFVPVTRTISTTSPLSGGGDLSADRTFAISQATTSTDGYLSSTDWNTFNDKAANVIDVFLASGQSNAVGQGDSSTSTVPITGTVFQYYSGTISAGADPVGAANTGSAWPAFGASYYQESGHKVLLVPYAINGSSLLAAADQGSGNWDTTGALFGNATTLASAAMAAASAAGYTPRFVGVLWSQGEADAKAINSATITGSQYQTALEAFPGRFQTAMGTHCRLFVIQTGTDTNESDTGYAAVRAAQLAAAVNNPDVQIMFFDTLDFFNTGMMLNHVHYNQTGLNLIGRIGAQNVLGQIVHFVNTALPLSGGGGLYKDLTLGLTPGYIRQVVQADFTYYVDPGQSGASDSNDGLSDTANHALLTLQGAANKIALLDLGSHTVTVQLADNGSNYASAIISSLVGTNTGLVIVKGNASTPSNTTVAGSSTNAILVVGPSSAQVTIQDLKVTTTGSGDGIRAQFPVQVNYKNVEFGACATAQVHSNLGAFVTATGNYSISGNATYHFFCNVNGSVGCSSRTITLTGTPAYSSRFAYATTGGNITAFTDTFSGSATGQRYYAEKNGIIDTNGGGANYFPGDSAGSTATGGQYI